MAGERPMATPPTRLGGAQRGQVVVKPKNMKGTLLRLWKLTAGHRRGLGWIFVFSCLASLSGVLSPYVIGQVIDRINEGNPAVFLLLLLAGVYVCDWFSRFMQHFLMAGVGQRIVAHIRKVLFSKMKQLPLAYFDKSTH